MNKGNLYVCLSNGTPLKLSAEVLSQFQSYDGPFFDERDFWGDIVGLHFLGSFEFINRFSGFLVDFEYAEEVASRYGLEDYWEVVKAACASFQNCPVVWPLPGGEKVRDWYSVCGVTPLINGAASNEESSGNTEDNRRPIGRPPLKPAVQEVYKERFPSGHLLLGLAMKEVRREVVGALGRDVSLSTVTRAVQELQKSQN